MGDAGCGAVGWGICSESGVSGLDLAGGEELGCRGGWGDSSTLGGGVGLGMRCRRGTRLGCGVAAEMDGNGEGGLISDAGPELISGVFTDSDRGVTGSGCASSKSDRAARGVERKP